MNPTADPALEPRPIDPLPAAAAQLPPPVAAVETDPAPGRYPQVAPAGQPFQIRARAFAPPHTPPLRGVIRWRTASGPRWTEKPLQNDGDNHFSGSWTPPTPGDYEWTVELWTGDDAFTRPGSSGADTLHLLRAERPELAAARWIRAARRPLLELAAATPPDAILLLPPIFPQDHEGRPGRDGVGHYTIDPTLGGVAEFGQLSAALASRHTALAMTVPLRCSPEHPFRQREPDAFTADGTPDLIAGDWPRRWEAWEAVFRFWLVQGIDLFHIPDPAAAPLAFWEHLIESLRHDFPGTAFSCSPDATADALPHLTGAGFWCMPSAHPTRAKQNEPTPAASIPCTCSHPDMRAQLTATGDGRFELRIENRTPARTVSGHVHLDAAALSLTEHDRYFLRDLTDGRAYRWSGTTNFIALEAGQPARDFHIERT